MMGLTNRCISEEDLFICPFTHANIARYIHAPGPKEKPNVFNFIKLTCVYVDVHFHSVVVKGFV